MAATLELGIVPVTPFQQNCSILRCKRSGALAVVDPGGDLDRIDAALAQAGGTLHKILLTHGHIDHCGEAGRFAQRHAVPIEGPHVDDRFWIDQLGEQGARFGLSALAPFEPDRWLVDGDTVAFGEVELAVRHCPGHTPGHVVFHSAPSALAIVGDVLFKGSIGRTDFPRGDHATLIASIRDRLWPMGDDTAFVPGHGPMSTFGDERRSNPYVAQRV